MYIYHYRVDVYKLGKREPIHETGTVDAPTAHDASNKIMEILADRYSYAMYKNYQLIKIN